MCRGVTECFHSKGKTLDDDKWLKISVNGAAISWEISLRNLAGSASGPIDIAGSREFKWDKTKEMGIFKNVNELTAIDFWGMV